MTEETCNTCRFCTPHQGAAHGYCRSSPPQYTHTEPDNSGRMRPRFFNPTVSLDSFCGEWEG